MARGIFYTLCKICPGIFLVNNFLVDQLRKALFRANIIGHVTNSEPRRIYLDNLICTINFINSKLNKILGFAYLYSLISSGGFDRRVIKITTGLLV